MRDRAEVGVTIAGLVIAATFPLWVRWFCQLTVVLADWIGVV